MGESTHAPGEGPTHTKSAVALLAEIDSSGGHKYARDALVAATARAAHPPVVVLTSDPEDLQRLRGPRVAVLKT
ncbi:hypothetical protein ACIPPS_29120 [Streptomyces sp. NPDC090127]|uniref:hypothetical protein n=1 Tax=Streptomyces sp. NPDC090127 TaxID=3365953 RepID=UPI0037FE6EC2